MKHPLTGNLPAQILMDAFVEQPALWPILELARGELDDAQPGSKVAVSRVCELLFIYMLRRFASQNPNLPGFVAAIQDRVTNKALQLIHERAGDNWTLDSLARASGLSRAAFSARFRRLDGIPPMEYLTNWRMHTARRLLQVPGAHVSAISRQVGYRSETGFSRAFKNHFNKSPRTLLAKLPS
jgi:AraC-like DNA-binding protein